MKGRWNWRAVKGLSAFVYLAMMLPLLVVVLNSFHPDRIPTFPPKSLSIRWYEAFLADQMLIDALVFSTKIAALAAIGCGIVGTLTALGFVRYDFPLKKGLVIAVLSPMLVPPVIIGLASTMFFGEVGLSRGTLWIATMHVLIGLPYAFLVIRSRLYLFDETLEEAAMTLGASRLRTFREITFPIIAPSILTGMVLAFVISFGEFTATQFWVVGSKTTVPVVIYTMLETLITPKVNVLATFVLVVTIAIPAIGMLIQRQLTATSE